MDPITYASVVTTLLIVDDDPELRSMLRVLLEDDGYRVLEAGDAESALYLFSCHAVDVVLVDIRLPGMSGLELCREIRHRGRTPIVAVTAQAGQDAVAAGLQAGADDYVTKPIVAAELSARLQSTLHQTREAQAEGTTLRAGDVTIHLPDGVVHRRGQRLRLSRVDSLLLAALAERPNTMMRRELLAEKIWGPDRVEDLRVVDRAVKRLRATLEMDTPAPVQVVAIPDVGYQLVL